MSKNLMMVFQILCKSFYNFNCTIFTMQNLSETAILTFVDSFKPFLGM